MTVRDLLIIDDVDVDVCDDYDERCYIAYCGGYNLTDEGVKEFADALDIEATGFCGGFATLHCECGEQAEACKELFNSLAGYCSADDFDKWFVER